MSIAYIISAYKQPAQLMRLVDRLNEHDTFFVIHIDARSTPDFSAVISRLLRYPNVVFMPARRFRYRSFDHVWISLSGISLLISHNIVFEHVALLTGQDYPIKPLSYIRSFLLRHRGKSFLRSFPLPDVKWLHGGLNRYRSWHFFILNRHLELPKYGEGNRYKRDFPRGFQPYGGSGYWFLARNAAEYVFTFWQSHPDFVRFFRFVDVPDEIFFQTILMNSPLRDSIIDMDPRYIDWDKPGVSHPAILTEDDFDRFSDVEYIFARKFDIAVDERVLNLIDERILESTG